jgi:DNA-directed RNA polymerase subunit N (RpoN/RPB10)
MDSINSYELPVIRCYNCNKPLAHLLEKYHELLSIFPNHPNRNIEIFDILNIKNSCCREKIAQPEIIIINKPDENTIYDITEKIEPKITKLKIKPVEIPISNKIIKNEEGILIPIHINVGHKRKNISDELYINYATDVTFIAR